MRAYYIQLHMLWSDMNMSVKTEYDLPYIMCELSVLNYVRPNLLQLKFSLLFVGKCLNMLPQSATNNTYRLVTRFLSKLLKRVK